MNAKQIIDAMFVIAQAAIRDNEDRCVLPREGHYFKLAKKEAEEILNNKLAYDDDPIVVDDPQDLLQNHELLVSRIKELEAENARLNLRIAGF